MQAAALDCGFWSPANLALLERLGIEAYIATGRDPHDRSWRERFALTVPLAPPAAASAREQMAYKLRTAAGRAIYGLRKCTVEPVLGIIKEVLGFRQFSLQKERESGRKATGMKAR